MTTRIATRSIHRLAVAGLAVLALAGPAAPAALAARETATTADTAICPAAEPAAQVLTDPGAGIRSRLDSEYLREIASSWYPAVIVVVPDPGSPAFIRSRLDSEYLHGLAADWYPELVACANPSA